MLNSKYLVLECCANVVIFQPNISMQDYLINYTLYILDSTQVYTPPLPCNWTCIYMAHGRVKPKGVHYTMSKKAQAYVPIIWTKHTHVQLFSLLNVYLCTRHHTQIKDSKPPQTIWLARSIAGDVRDDVHEIRQIRTQQWGIDYIFLLEQMHFTYVQINELRIDR